MRLVKCYLPVGMCLVGLVGFAARADERYVFRPCGTPLPISDDRIMDLYESPDGHLWVAVWGRGVCRLQGTESRTFTAASGLPSNWSRCVTPDNQGRIWVGGADGLCRIDGDQVLAFTSKDTPAMPSNSIRCGTRLDSGALCFGMSDGGVLCVGRSPFVPATADTPATGDPALGVDPDWTYVGYPDIPARDGVDDILETSDGSIWLALHTGAVLRFKGGRWQRYDDASGLPVGVYSLYQDSAGSVWGVGGAQLAVFDGESWAVLEDAAENPRAVAESSDHKLVVGTERGLRIRTDGTWKTLDLGPEIGTPAVWCLLFGTTGTPWVGTREGLIRGYRPIWRRFSATEAGALIRSAPLYADLHTPPLSADHDGNLITFESGRWRTKASVPDDRFRPKWFSSPRDGVLWALCPHDALCINVDSGEIVRAVPLPTGAECARIKWGPDGTPWLLGRDGVHVLEKNGWRALDRSPKTRDSWAFDLCVSKDGSVFICYETAIDQWRDGIVRPFHSTDRLFHDGHYTTVRCLRDGTVWFGTYGRGILVYDGAGVTQITRNDGLLSDHISQIFEASNGAIWISYRRKGVASCRNGRWVNFSHRHGLPNVAGTAFGEYPADTIWLAASMDEIYQYTSDNQGPDTTITAAPDTIAARGTGVFSFNGVDAWQRTLQRDLAYTWRIVPDGGTEPPWGPIQSTTTAVVSGLPAGLYTFQVRATDEDRNEDRTPSVIPVTVEPPFYARAEFAVPVGLLTALVALSLVFLYVKQSRLQESEKRLRHALAHIKTLGGLIPICSSCKRIRDDSGYWNQLESYIRDHSEAQFSHAICPDCAKQIYGVDDLMDGSGSDDPES